MKFNKKQKIILGGGLLLILLVAVYFAIKPIIKIEPRPAGYKSEAAGSLTGPFEILGQDEMTIIIDNPSPTP